VPTVAVETAEATRTAAVEALIKAGKLEDATYYVCNAYGFTAGNLRVTIVDSMDDAWAKTNGDLEEGAIETVRIGRDLFQQDYAFMVRVIGHEFQHVKQRSQKDPIQESSEREFLAWSWMALEPGLPASDGAALAKQAKTANEYYDKMPDLQKKKYAARKKQLDDIIAKNP
jgi:hypothetical protein